MLSVADAGGRGSLKGETITIDAADALDREARWREAQVELLKLFAVMQSIG